MTELAADTDSTGPVDHVTVEFPPTVEKLLQLAGGGIIRVLDLLIITKQDDASEELRTEIDGIGHATGLLPRRRGPGSGTPLVHPIRWRRQQTKARTLSHASQPGLR